MDPFVGEIRLLPFNFAPRGWAFCQGQLLTIQSNTALFALLGTQYGGNGSTTFGLPNLQGRAIVGIGQGVGLTNYAIGNMVGTESVTLNLAQLPVHNHPSSGVTVPVSTVAGGANSPAGGYFAPANNQYGDLGGGGNMAAGLLNGSSAGTGGSIAHENRLPFLVLNYCIATQGVFPQRQ